MNRVDGGGAAGAGGSCTEMDISLGTAAAEGCTDCCGGGSSGDGAVGAMAAAGAAEEAAPPEPTAAVSTACPSTWVAARR
jgi:hypothetical protein